MEQSFLHTHSSTVSLTSFRTGAVPDRQSPAGFPPVRGLPDYESPAQLAGALSPGTPEVPMLPKLAPTDTPESPD